MRIQLKELINKHLTELDSAIENNEVSKIKQQLEIMLKEYVFSKVARSDIITNSLFKPLTEEDFDDLNLIFKFYTQSNKACELAQSKYYNSIDKTLADLNKRFSFLSSESTKKEVEKTLTSSSSSSSSLGSTREKSNQPESSSTQTALSLLTSPSTKVEQSLVTPTPQKTLEKKKTDTKEGAKNRLAKILNFRSYTTKQKEELISILKTYKGIGDEIFYNQSNAFGLILCKGQNELTQFWIEQGYNQPRLIESLETYLDEGLAEINLTLRGQIKATIWLDNNTLKEKSHAQNQLEPMSKETNPFSSVQAEKPKKPDLKQVQQKEPKVSLSIRTERETKKLLESRDARLLKSLRPAACPRGLEISLGSLDSADKPRNVDIARKKSSIALETEKISQQIDKLPEVYINGEFSEVFSYNKERMITPEELDNITKSKSQRTPRSPQLISSPVPEFNLNPFSSLLTSSSSSSSTAQLPQQDTAKFDRLIKRFAFQKAQLSELIKNIKIEEDAFIDLTKELEHASQTLERINRALQRTNKDLDQTQLEQAQVMVQIKELKRKRTQVAERALEECTTLYLHLKVVLQELLAIIPNTHSSWAEINNFNEKLAQLKEEYLQGVLNYIKDDMQGMQEVGQYKAFFAALKKPTSKKAESSTTEKRGQKRKTPTPDEDYTDESHKKKRRTDETFKPKETKKIKPKSRGKRTHLTLPSSSQSSLTTESSTVASSLQSLPQPTPLNPKVLQLPQTTQVPQSLSPLSLSLQVNSISPTFVNPYSPTLLPTFNPFGSIQNPVSNSSFIPLQNPKSNPDLSPILSFSQTPGLSTSLISDAVFNPNQDPSSSLIPELSSSLISDAVFNPNPSLSSSQITESSSSLITDADLQMVDDLQKFDFNNDLSSISSSTLNRPVSPSSHLFFSTKLPQSEILSEEDIGSLFYLG